MKSTKVRGYVMAAVAVAACVGTWTAVVHADEGLQQAAGVYRATARSEIRRDLAARWFESDGHHYIVLR